MFDYKQKALEYIIEGHTTVAVYYFLLAEHFNPNDYLSRQQIWRVNQKIRNEA